MAKSSLFLTPRALPPSLIFMERFFLISILFHGIALVLLFSWEVPLANRLFPRNIIEVSLVAEKERKSEERNTEGAKPPPSNSVKKKEAPAADRPLQPEAKKEEKKEEKKEKPQEEIKAPIPAAGKEEKTKEEKTKPEEKIIPQEKNLTAGASKLSEGPVPAPLPSLGVAKASGPPPQVDLDLGTGERAGKERTGSAFFVPKTSNILSEEIGPGKGARIPGLEKGEGSPGPMSSIRSGSEAVDPTLMAIMRKIEAVKRYPKTARRMGIEGTAKVRFKVRPDGQVEAIEIVESSGSEILDEASLETIREAAPLPFKEGWLKVGIVFKIL